MKETKLKRRKDTMTTHRERTREERMLEFDEDYKFRTYTTLILQYLARGYDFETADKLAYKEACEHAEHSRNYAREDFLEEAVMKASERQ